MLPARRLVWLTSSLLAGAVACGTVLSDPGPPPNEPVPEGDAGRDAAEDRVDAALDGAPPATPPPPPTGLPCDGGCASGSCCVGESSSRCVTLAAGCNSLLRCMRPSDCLGAERCCIASNDEGVTSICAETCDVPARPVCERGVDCGSEDESACAPYDGAFGLRACVE